MEVLTVSQSGEVEMEENQFTQYKPYLKEYLSTQGIESSKSPIFCFAPDHNNTDTPACILHDDHFKCMSCGVEGDIFDAVGLLHNTTDKAEQLKIIQALFPHGTSPTPTRKQEGFKSSPQAEKNLHKYLWNYKGREELVKAYLKERGCSEEMQDKLWENFGWWPGYTIAEKDCTKHALFNAGIPMMNPKTKTYSWGPAGAVAKIGSGFKLFFFEEKGDKKKSKKMGTKKCRTFPFPSMPQGNVCYLVEGELSAAAMRFAGYEAVATGGVHGLTKEVSGSLLRYKKIVLVFDGDTAGIEGPKGPSGVMDRLKRVSYTGELSMAKLPEGMDPDDLIKSGKYEDLKKCIDTAKVESLKDHVARSEEVPVPTITAPFLFLGYDESGYYFMPHNQNIPLRIARGNTALKNNIEELAPHGWWFSNFMLKKNEKEMMFDQIGALTWVRDESYKRGVYDPTKILGIGIHGEGENLYLNTGKSLLVYATNTEISYGEYFGNLVFSRSRNIISIPDHGWTMEDRKNFVVQLKTFTFENSLDRLCVAGFVAIASYASLLERCPHIWITAEKGAGKTFLLDTIVSPGLGEHALHVEGRSTEAGVRQSIGNDCRPVVMDEFEANNKGEEFVIQSILALARSAYGGREVVKGTVGHEAARFKTKMMFCFSSVKTYLTNAADSSRIAMVRMKQSNGRMTSVPDMAGLRRLIYNRLPELLTNCAAAKQRILTAGFDDRTADTYSPLLAGYWMIISDQDFMDGTDSQNEGMLAAIKEISKDSVEDDESVVFNHILRSNITISPGVTRTVAEMLNKRDKFTPSKLKYGDVLQRIGIRRLIKLIDGVDVEILAISCKHSELKRLLYETAYTEYKDVMSRHKAFIPSGGDRKHPSLRMSGTTQRCMMFSWGMIEKEFIGEPDEYEKRLAAEPEHF